MALIDAISLSEDNEDSNHVLERPPVDNSDSGCDAAAQSQACDVSSEASDSSGVSSMSKVKCLCNSANCRGWLIVWQDPLFSLLDNVCRLINRVPKSFDSEFSIFNCHSLWHHDSRDDVKSSNVDTVETMIRVDNITDVQGRTISVLKKSSLNTARSPAHIHLLLSFCYSISEYRDTRHARIMCLLCRCSVLRYGIHITTRRQLKSPECC